MHAYCMILSSDAGFAEIHRWRDTDDGDRQSHFPGSAGVVRRDGAGARAPPPGEGLRRDQVRRPAHRAGEPVRRLLLPGQGLRCLRARPPHADDAQHPRPDQGPQHPLGHDEPPAGGGVLRQHEDVPQSQVGNPRPRRLPGLGAGPHPPAGPRRLQHPGAAAGAAHQPSRRHAGHVHTTRRSKTT